MVKNTSLIFLGTALWVALFCLPAHAQSVPGGSLPSVVQLTQNLRRIAWVIRTSPEPIEAFYPAEMKMSPLSQDLLGLLKGAFSNETAALFISRMPRTEYLAFVRANEARWLTNLDYHGHLAHRLFALKTETKENLLAAFERALAEDPNVIDQETAKALLMQAQDSPSSVGQRPVDANLHQVIEREKASMRDWAHNILQATSPREIEDLLYSADESHSGWVYLLRILDEGAFGDFQVYMLKTLGQYEGIWEALPDASKAAALRDWLLMAKATLISAKILSPESFRVPTRSVLAPRTRDSGDLNLDWIDFRRVSALLNFARVHLHEELFEAELLQYLTAYKNGLAESNSDPAAHLQAISTFPTVPPIVEAYREFKELNLALTRIEEVYFPDGSH